MDDRLIVGSEFESFRLLRGLNLGEASLKQFQQHVNGTPDDWGS
jgi:hypothetical protein